MHQKFRALIKNSREMILHLCSRPRMNRRNLCNSLYLIFCEGAYTRNLITSNCLIIQEPFDIVKEASMGAFFLKNDSLIIHNFSNQSHLIYGNIDSISILSKVNKQNPISQIFHNQGKIGSWNLFLCVSQQ